MKNIKIKYNDQQGTIVEGILFEDVNDAELLIKELKKAEQSVIEKFVKSKESPERLGHIVNGFRPIEKCIAKYAITFGNFRGQNPLYLLGESVDNYISTFTKMFTTKPTFYNTVNGCLTYLDDQHEILEESEFTGFPNPPKYFIGKNSKVINLENDFELEAESISYMTAHFGSNYSYIKDMKTYDAKDFEKVFAEFVEQGGEVVYVYTTGMDNEQMYLYATSAIKCGIKNFTFDFNAGVDREILKFVDWLAERKVKVNLLNK